jgi:hypothetical protein
MRWCGIAVHWRGDVIDRKHKMIFRRDMRRPLHPVDQSEQGNDVLRSGLVDRSVEA